MTSSLVGSEMCIRDRLDVLVCSPGIDAKLVTKEVATQTVIDDKMYMVEAFMQTEEAEKGDEDKNSMALILQRVAELNANHSLLEESRAALQRDM
eukprot:620916-Prorocentrum_lima.AAC.1